MPKNQENSDWVGPAVLSGIADLIVWKSLSPNTKEKIWRFLDAVAEAQERKRLASDARVQRPFPEFGETPCPDVLRELPATIESGTKTDAATPQPPIPEQISLLH